jgi:hypothetical protein
MGHAVGDELDLMVLSGRAGWYPHRPDDGGSKQL